MVMEKRQIWDFMGIHILIKSVLDKKQIWSWSKDEEGHLFGSYWVSGPRLAAFIGTFSLFLTQPWMADIVISSLCVETLRSRVGVCLAEVTQGVMAGSSALL